MNQDVVEPVTHSIRTFLLIINSAQQSGTQTIFIGIIKLQTQSPSIKLTTHSLLPSQISQLFSTQLKQQTHRFTCSKFPVTLFCESLPRTRPRYSFTFGQPVEGSAINSNIKTYNNAIKNVHSPRGFVNVNIEQRVFQPNSQRKPQQRNIRRDIDVCLYTIADKLKEVEQSKQTREFVNNKLGQGEMAGYKPSFSQLRKNKKLFLDRSIHRIHPEIVNEYIETIYRDYDIPNPIDGSRQGQRLDQTERINVGKIQRQNALLRQNEKIREKQVLRRENNRKIVQKQRNEIVGRQLYERLQRQTQQNQKQQTYNIPTIQQKEPQQRVTFQVNQQPTKQPQRQLFRQQYSLYNTKQNRKNNLIQQKAQNKGKKHFLNLTLSKQKNIQAKTFQSPQREKTIKNQDKESEKSSRSKSKHSQSQKRILEIKKNISSWKDSQHQFAQRYSYLQSPYERIRNQPQAQREPIDSGKQVNVVIRPFDELMKVTAPTEYHEQASHAINTTTQYVTNASQLQESKYVQSFFTVQGEVMQEFRYCILCQQSVLSANIFKHQDKCIGWIDDSGKLYNFKSLYQMQKEDQLRALIRSKIEEIRKRLSRMVEKIREKEQMSQPQRQQQNLSTRILQTVQNYLQSYTNMTQPTNASQNYHLFTSSFNNLQKLSKDEYLQLLQQSRKLHWFIKLLQNYQHRGKSVYKNQEQKDRMFTSTRARHNLSLTFVEEQLRNNMTVSEFAEHKDSTF